MASGAGEMESLEAGSLLGQTSLVPRASETDGGLLVGISRCWLSCRVKCALDTFEQEDALTFCGRALIIASHRCRTVTLIPHLQQPVQSLTASAAFWRPTPTSTPSSGTARTPPRAAPAALPPPAATRAPRIPPNGPRVDRGNGVFWHHVACRSVVAEWSSCSNSIEG
jgi:hypothetical protein